MPGSKGLNPHEFDVYLFTIYVLL